MIIIIQLVHFLTYLGEIHNLNKKTIKINKSFCIFFEEIPWILEYFQLFWKVYNFSTIELKMDLIPLII